MPWNPITLLKPARWIRKHNMHSTRMKQKEQGPAQQRAPDDDELSFICISDPKGRKNQFSEQSYNYMKSSSFSFEFFCARPCASFIDARYWPASRKEQNNDICNVSVSPCLCVWESVYKSTWTNNHQSWRVFELCAGFYRSVCTDSVEEITALHEK